MAKTSSTRYSTAKVFTRPRDNPFIYCFRLCLFIFVFLVAAQAAAQQPPASRLRVTVRVVNVDVSVTDAKGNFLSGLTAQNFRILEDGQLRPVAHFSPERVPVRIVLLLEATPAVFLIQQDHFQAAFHLLPNLRPEDEAALLTYDRDLQVEADFTRDKRRLQQHLMGLGRFSMGMAEMKTLDAIAGTLDWIGPDPPRTAVLLIGTGIDSGSTTGWKALARRLAGSQVTFFALATGYVLREEPGKKSKSGKSATGKLFDQADSLLREIAKTGSGQAYFPKTASELPGIYRRIAERMRNLYSLGYYPVNRARDGRFRRITVELVDETGAPLLLRNGKKKLMTPRVFARKGYFAPKE